MSFTIVNWKRKYESGGFFFVEEMLGGFENQRKDNSGQRHWNEIYINAFIVL